jgi:hypothetical protein
MRRCFRRHALIVGVDGSFRQEWGRVMSIRSRRLLLLSSSALVLLCIAGIASSQTTETPPDTPPATTTTPETPATPSPAPETPAPQPSQPAPETPQAEPGTAPAVPIPQVTVEAPKPRPARRTAPAAPARTTTRLPPPPAPPPTTTPPAAPTTTTAGQPAATSPQPPPSLNTLNSAQIQASESKSLGGLLFTMPGATSAGLASASTTSSIRTRHLGRLLIGPPLSGRMNVRKRPRSRARSAPSATKCSLELDRLCYNIIMLARGSYGPRRDRMS